jgi:hypothetical protein
LFLTMNTVRQVSERLWSWAASRHEVRERVPRARG